MRPVSELLKAPVLGHSLHDVLYEVFDFIANLDDDEDDRQGLIAYILPSLMSAGINYKVNTRMEFPPLTTDDTWELYNDIYTNLQGGRFAMWYKDADAVYQIASIPGNYLEIGTAHGGSAVMAGKAKKSGGIYCVDPLNERHHVIGNFHKFGIEGVTLIRKMTPPLPEELDGIEFSAVLIDADHTGLFPRNDWLSVKDKVTPGGYVMFHDIHRKACYSALQLAAETPGWTKVAEYSHIGHGFSTDRSMGTFGIVQRNNGI